MRAYKLITAYGSPASSKMRAFLRWANLPVREQPATALVLKSEVRPRVQANRVPVLVTPSNEALHDTRLIADWVRQHEPGPELTPEYGHHRFAARLIEAFGDEVLAPASVYHFWAHNEDIAASELGASVYPDHDGETQARYARLLSKQMLKTLEERGYGPQSEDETAALLGQVVKDLDAHLADHDFLFGAQPCEADFALFGPLTLLRTRGEGDVVNGYVNVQRWLGAVNAPFSTREKAFPKEMALPDSLVRLIQIAAQRFLPEALETCKALSDWAEQHPGQIGLPASVGERTLYEDTNPVEQSLRPGVQWAFQRVLEPLKETGMPKPERSAIDDLLSRIGFGDLGAFQAPRTVLQEHFQYTIDLKAGTPSPKTRKDARQTADALVEAGSEADASGALGEKVTG